MSHGHFNQKGANLYEDVEMLFEAAAFGEQILHISKRNYYFEKAPVIRDYNDVLKNEGVIDIPTWRFIQMLADIRNLCDHNKTEDPTKENLKDLIDGTDKIIKMVFDMKKRYMF